LYLTGRAQSPCLEKQGGRLYHSLQSRLGDAHGTREETSRCSGRLHRRPPHVGTEPHGSSPPPLHRLGRRPVTGEVDLLEEEVPLPREGHVPIVQREVPRLSQKSVRKKGALIRRGRVHGLLAQALREGVGGLCKASLQRARERPRLPREVYPPDRHYQPSHHRRGEWQGLLLMEGLCRWQ